MNMIEKSYLVNLNSKENIIEKSIEYFSTSGFNKVDSGESHIKFEGGSTLTNFVTLNPLKWKSKITIELKETELIVHLNIKTTGQMVTDHELKTWKDFIDNFELFLNQKDFNFKAENDSAVRKARSKNINLIKWISIGMLVGLIPGILIIKITGYQQAGIVTIMSFGVFMFLYKNAEKK